MPDSLSPTLTEIERKSAADRLWDIVAMIDRGAPMSDIRGAIQFTAFTMENAGWTRDRPMNAEAA